MVILFKKIRLHTGEKSVFLQAISGILNLSTQLGHAPDYNIYGGYCYDTYTRKRTAPGKNR